MLFAGARHLCRFRAKLSKTGKHSNVGSSNCLVRVFITQCRIVPGLSGPLINRDTRPKRLSSAPEITPARMVKIENPTDTRLHRTPDQRRETALGGSPPQKCHRKIFRRLFVHSRLNLINVKMLFRKNIRSPFQSLEYGYASCPRITFKTTLFLVIRPRFSE